MKNHKLTWMAIEHHDGWWLYPAKGGLIDVGLAKARGPMTWEEAEHTARHLNPPKTRVGRQK